MAIPDLVLGSFDLTDWAGVNYQTSVIAEGTSRGAPVPLEVAVKTWLQDGSIVITQGYDNREVNLRVKFRGPNLTAVAQAEAAFFAELGKPNTLTWTPPSGPASVFNVITSSMQEAPSTDSDVAEGMAFPWRTYNVRLVCEAFVRSTTETVVTALAASGTTTTLVDAGSATTNWTGTTNGVGATVAVVSGAVGVTTASLTIDTTISLTRTASITTSSTKYLVVDYRPTVGGFVKPHAVTDLRAYGDGTELPRIGTVPVSATTYRATFLVAASSIAALRLDLLVRAQSDGTSSAGSQARTFHVDNINRTDIRPSIGTARQLVRSLALTGSAPTPGSLTVQHGTNALGDVLVYTWADLATGPTLYSPPCRQYRSASSSSTTTADTSLVSGARDLLAGTGEGFIDYDIPHSALPQGSYLILVRAAGTTSFTGALQWKTQTRVNATAIDTLYISPSVTAAFTTTYAIYVLGRVVLPQTDVRDVSNGTLRFDITNKSGNSKDVNVDEAWLFNTSTGQLVQVSCGTGSAASGGPSRRLFIDPATVARPRPVVLRGHAADGSDAFYAGVLSWQNPRFAPPAINILTVTTNTTDADVAFSYYARWHTNAAS